MSDSRKYLLGAAATIVAARIQAHSAKGGAALSVKDEFLSVYRDLDAAFAELGGGEGGQKPYAKKSRELDNLKDD